MSGTDAPSGRLGAVLRSLGEPSPVSLGPHGPLVATTLEHARLVLTDPERFDFPMDVSRRAMRARSVSDQTPGGRSPHAITPPLDAKAVARGLAVFEVELRQDGGSISAGNHVDVMDFLRTPVARSTTAAVLQDVEESDRDHVASLVLSWIDSLGPVIASPRNPGRWSRIRRNESHCRDELHVALERLGRADPASIATLLAAGIQVPIAAGAWLLVKLAENPRLSQVVRARPELARAVAWETVRVSPPTWITARITADEVKLGATLVAAGSVIMVSPLLLGRVESLAPGCEAGASPLDQFDPLRWDQDRVRPGAWLPFGAGPHACPGRNLGLAQLTALAEWARPWAMTPVDDVYIDQSRGIFPKPARLRFDDARDHTATDPGNAAQEGAG